MDPASASTRVIRSLAGKADDVIRAYHGSPHSFSRFDASKIGTGEGAQVYGHGLYFAGHEAVAEAYRRQLAGLPEVLIEGRSAMDLRGKHAISSPEWRALTQLWHRAVDSSGAEGVQHAMDIADDSLRRVGDDQAAEALQRIVSGRPVTLGPRPGHMYEVQIDYPEEALLNYDRPFSSPAGARGAEVLRQRNPAALTEATLRGIQDGSWRMESYPFNNPYERAGIELARLARTRGGAQALSEAGIPGIRYLDQGSRSAGQGTHNYVMFPGTEDRIKILRQYGLLPPLMAPALMEDE